MAAQSTHPAVARVGILRPHPFHAQRMTSIVKRIREECEVSLVRLPTTTLMPIFVMTVTGKKMTLFVNHDGSESIDTIKTKIAIMEGICVTRQKLFFNEQQLDDEPSMAFYQIKRLSILVLQVQMIGHVRDLNRAADRDFDSEMNSRTDGESTCAPESSSDEEASSEMQV